MCNKERSQLELEAVAIRNKHLCTGKINTFDVRNQWETNIEAPDVTLTVLFSGKNDTFSEKLPTGFLAWE